MLGHVLLLRCCLLDESLMISWHLPQECSCLALVSCLNSNSGIYFLLHWNFLCRFNRICYSYLPTINAGQQHWCRWIIYPISPQRQPHFCGRAQGEIIPVYIVSKVPGDPFLVDEKNCKCKVLLVNGFVVSHSQATLRFLMFLSCSL